MSARKAPKRRAKVGARPDGSIRNLEKARRLFSQVRPILLAYPGVIGVSVGLREKDEVETGEAAFVVSVVRKRARLKTVDRLPAQLLGLPIDVQQARVPKLKQTVAGGKRVWRKGVGLPGHLGFVAQDQHGAHFALTALHVLVKERAVEQFAFGGGPYFPVLMEVDGVFQPIGQLWAGEFDMDSDVACIKLDAGNVAVPKLTGSDVELGRPANPNSVPLQSSATLIVPDGPGELPATLIHYPYDGIFECDAGPLHFSNLLKFRVFTPRIKDGWSGSVLFRTSSEQPLALISFGTDQPDANGNSFAYGFPLNAHYAAWGLRSL